MLRGKRGVDAENRHIYPALALALTCENSAIYLSNPFFDHLIILPPIVIHAMAGFAALSLGIVV